MEDWLWLDQNKLGAYQVPAGEVFDPVEFVVHNALLLQTYVVPVGVNFSVVVSNIFPPGDKQGSLACVYRTNLTVSDVGDFTSGHLDHALIVNAAHIRDAYEMGPKLLGGSITWLWRELLHAYRHVVQGARLKANQLIAAPDMHDAKDLDETLQDYIAREIKDRNGICCPKHYLAYDSVIASTAALTVLLKHATGQAQGNLWAEVSTCLTADNQTFREAMLDWQLIADT